MLRKEIATKGKHREPFDAETDKRGRHIDSDRMFDDDAA
jgi:hypothetical protein